ncbi:MAG: hypoxanthine-guanine phosphoribosyltransferase, partial [Thioalkalispiraceae bacterium]
MLNPEQVRKVHSEAECLYSAEQVQSAIRRMAGEIERDFAEKNPLILVVMTGAVIVSGQLLPHLSFPLEMDYIHATRYEKNTSGGKIKWLAEPATGLKGRAVLIIDDILDEGVTLAAIKHHCEQAGASEVSCAVLVDKHHDRKNGLKAEYVGLEIEDRYIFGFGMDYKGYLRNVNG